MKAKLTWLCRRGMRELDIILSDFAKNHYDSLPKFDQGLFIQLLSCEDSELFEWIFMNKQSDDKGIDRILHLLKKSTH